MTIPAGKRNDKASFLGSFGQKQFGVIPAVLLGAWLVLGPVDKLDSQISLNVIQGSFCGGYRGTTVDGKCGTGVFGPFIIGVRGRGGRPASNHQLVLVVFLDLDFTTKGT